MSQALFEAVRAVDLARVESALKAHPDVNAVGEARTTPLIEAARRGSAAVVKRLLAAGAEASWRDDDDETALLKAAANGHREVVALLLPLGSEDERDLARSFLAAFGHSHGPEYRFDEDTMKTRFAEVSARTAEFFGDAEPARRLERLARAKKNQGR
jgi:ankyrin repeat protein